jgi:hypothetical protein
VLGHSIELGFVVIGIVAALTMRVTYTRINKKRDEAIDPEYHHDAQEMDALGDRAPTFRYKL